MKPQPCFERAQKPQNVHALIVVKRFQLLLSALLLFTASSAQNIGNWTLNNTLSGTGTASNSVSAISAGPGVASTSFNGGTEWYGQNGFPTGGVCDANAYLQFTITPNSGFELNISSVVLRMRRSNTGSPAGSGPTQWCLRSSLDGYATDLASGSMTHNYSNYTALLTGFYQVPSAVTFRLYGYSVTVGSGGNSRLVLDNVSIQGSLFILPLKLQAPEVRADENGHVFLSWKAEDVEAGTIFHLQRSPDGISFETIYSNNTVYHFVDKTASGQKLYYRVEAVEPNGTRHLSRVVSVTRNIAARLHIEKITLRGSMMQAVVQLPAKGNYTISIFSSSGILLHKQSLFLNEGAQSIPVALHKLSNGMYVLNISGNNSAVSRPFLFPVP